MCHLYKPEILLKRASGMRFSALLLCSALTVSACNRTSGTGDAKEDLQLVPKEADIVVMANVARMRNTAMWRKILDVKDSDPQTKKDFDEFVQKCSFDPL